MYARNSFCQFVLFSCFVAVIEIVFLCLNLFLSFLLFDASKPLESRQLYV